MRSVASIALVVVSVNGVEPPSLADVHLIPSRHFAGRGNMLYIVEKELRASIQLRNNQETFACVMNQRIIILLIALLLNATFVVAQTLHRLLPLISDSDSWPGVTAFLTTSRNVASSKLA